MGLINCSGEQRMWVNSRKAILLNSYTGGFLSKFRVTANNNRFSYLSGNRCILVKQFSTNINNMKIESLGVLKRELLDINNNIRVLINHKV
jgi:hypothetical protein